MLAESSFVTDVHSSALTDIYQDEITLAVWRRQLDTQVAMYAQQLMSVTPLFQTRLIQTPVQIEAELNADLPQGNHRQAFIADVVLVAEMYACLFELEFVGMRLSTLQTAMCPKFHVDRVPARLITTYAGTKGTEWHSTENVARFEDGSLVPVAGANPNILGVGDVALLKGEMWSGNEGRGLVHRSPQASSSERRLVMTLDFA